jgi:anti-sigma regulatory factor (Ser/Thr protein kinase)
MPAADPTCARPGGALGMGDPAGGPGELLAEVFTGGKVAATRHAVMRAAAGAGLSEQRLDDFVLAVNEIITNAVRYAEGRGRVRLWASASAVCCEVTDAGPGIPLDWINREAPPGLVAGGRGLWMARQLCDDVDVRTGPAGTAVLLSVALDGHRPPLTPAGSPPTATPKSVVSGSVVSGSVVSGSMGFDPPTGPPPPWPPIPPR